MADHTLKVSGKDDKCLSIHSFGPSLNIFSPIKFTITDNTDGNGEYVEINVAELESIISYFQSLRPLNNKVSDDG